MKSSACLTCRRRKIKCDGRPGGCLNCERFGEDCNSTVKGPESPSQLLTEAGFRRRRARLSCIQCRKAKTRCSGTEPCSRCQHRRWACVFTASQRPVSQNVTGLSSMMDPANSPESQSTASPPTALSFAPAPPQPRPSLPPALGKTLPSPLYSRPGKSDPAAIGRHKLDSSLDGSSVTPPESTEAAKLISGATLVGAPDPLASSTNHPTNSNGSDHRSLPKPSFGAEAIPEWLLSPELPNREQTHELVSIYLDRFHTLRCNGFIHAPTFRERLDHGFDAGAEPQAMLYLILAIAAPYKAIEYMKTDDFSRVVEAGKGWSVMAKNLLLGNLHTSGPATVNRLMCYVLLYEYLVRTGNYSQAFLISGILARLMHLLQLNVEYDFDVLCSQGELPWISKESRRRLAWACFLIDASIENGTEQLRYIPSSQFQVQLPSNEEAFEYGTPRVTEVLEPGKVLSWAPHDPGDDPYANIDIRGFYIRVMAVRSDILQYGQSLTASGTPWQPDSQFSQFAKQLDVFERHFPEAAQIPAKISQSKQKDRLGLIYGLQVLLCQTYCSLYRLGVKGLAMHNHNIHSLRAAAPVEFLAVCREMCHDQASRGSQLLSEVKDFDMLAMVDVSFAQHAHDLTRVLCHSLEGRVPTPGVQALLESNIAVLKSLCRFLAVDDYFESAVQTVTNLVERSPSSAAASDGAVNDSPAQPPPQYSLEYILNPLGTYRFARSRTEDKHAPETQSVLLPRVTTIYQFPNLGTRELPTEDMPSDISTYFDSFFTV